MKNKKLKIAMVSFLLMMMYFLANNSFATTNSDELLGKYNIYYKPGGKYISYDGRPQRSDQYFYKDRNGVEKHAYCLNLYMKGAEDGDYDVNVNEYLTNTTVSNILCSGYPYKSVQELELADESEAIFATQFAVWAYINPLDLNLIAPLDSNYQRVANAINNIYNNGTNPNFQKDNTFKVTSSTSETVIDQDRNYYSQQLHLEYNSNICEIKGNITGIDGIQIVDNNNCQLPTNLTGYKDIKILIPRENVLNDKIINCSFSVKAKNTSVLFGISTKPDYQNVGLMLEPMITNTVNTNINVKHVTADLALYKLDLDNPSQTISNVKFKISWADTNDLIGIYTTNQNGEINLSLEKEGKLKIEEIETNDNYYIDKDNCKFVNVKFGEKTPVSFKNEKIKGKIRIIKKSEDTNKYNNLDVGSPIPNTKFAILDKENNVIETVTTNDDGIAITSELLKGIYYVKEIENNDFYLKDDTIQKVEIVHHGQIIPVEFTNKSVNINVDVKKKRLCSNTAKQYH